MEEPHRSKYRVHRGYVFDSDHVNESEVDWCHDREESLRPSVQAARRHNQRLIDHMARIRSTKHWEDLVKGRKLKKELILDVLEDIRREADRAVHPSFARVRRNILLKVEEARALLSPPKATKKGKQLMFGVEESVDSGESALD